MLSQNERNMEFIERTKKIFHGYQLAERIVSNEPTTHYMILAKHHGDVMRQMKTILLFKEYYSEKMPSYHAENEIGKVFEKAWVIKKIVVITEESSAGIVRLYSAAVDEVITLSESELRDISLYSKCVSCVHRNLHRDEIGLNEDYKDSDALKTTLYGISSYRWMLNLPMNFGNENETAVGFLKISEETRNNAIRVLEANDIKPEKTVILLPYAKSTSMIDVNIWLEIIDNLKKYGFHIFTNIGKNEVALLNTEGLSVPFDVLVGLGQLGATIIGIQSGGTDIIRWVNCDIRLILISPLFTPNDIKIAKNRKIEKKGEYKENNYCIAIKKDETSEIRGLVMGHFSFIRKGYFQKSMFIEYVSKHMDDALYLATNLNEYVDQLIKRNDILIFITVNDSANKYWNNFNKNKLGLKSDLSDKWRKSYAAVIDAESGKVDETMMKNCKNTRLQGMFSDFQKITGNPCDDETHADFPVENYYYIVSHALGKNRYTKSTIVINGTDFSISKRGLNIVVYSKKACGVIDSVNVDMFGDSKLTIKRKGDSFWNDNRES